MSRIKKTLRRIISVETLLRYADRVGTVGCLLPLLHFVILPFGVFFFVIDTFLGHAESGNSMAEFVSIELPVASVRAFYWLLAFWAIAVVCGLIGFSLYRILSKAYADRPFERAVAKTILASIFASGAVERAIANKLMPMALDGTRLRLSVDDAPAFSFSLYRDLGALVRSPYWEIGSHSRLSTYTYLPLVALAAIISVYVVGRILREMRIATASIGPSKRDRVELDDRDDIGHFGTTE